VTALAKKTSIGADSWKNTNLTLLVLAEQTTDHPSWAFHVHIHPWRDSVARCAKLFKLRSLSQ